MSDITDQIKEKISVVDFIGEYLKLEKAGSNYKALCPFHNEKTPSFMVNPERNFWYCFGCQKGGDVFSFLMEIEGVDFKEALKRLAEKAGVELPRFNREQLFHKSKRQILSEILEKATCYFQNNLQQTAMGKKAADYLARRKIAPELQKEFRLGVSLDSWNALLDHLLKQGYQLKDIFDAGLLVQKNQNDFSNRSNFYDRFRSRIMFPIMDEVGRVVGFSARVLPPSQEEGGAKYINTPQTLVYDKSRILFGLFQAKTEIKRKGLAVIVEGNMDVIAAFSAGQRNVVAVSGTALTKDQLRIVGRYSKNIDLCFDMDSAGQSATEKSIKNCLEEDFNVGVVLLPSGNKDVGEIVEKEKTDLEKIFSQSRPVMEYFFEKNFKQFDAENPKERKAVAQNVLNIIKDIADPIEQSFWLKKLSEKLSIEEELLTEVLEKYRIRKENKARGADQENQQEFPSSQKGQSRLVLLEERLLGLFVLFKDEIDFGQKDIEKNLDKFSLREIWEKLLKGAVLSREEKERVDLVSAKLQYSYDLEEGFLENQLDPLAEWKLAMADFLQENKKREVSRIVAKIKELESSGQEEEAEKLIEKLDQLTKA